MRQNTRMTFGMAFLNVALVATLAISVVAGADDVVERRGAAPPLQGKVLKYDDAGVTIQTRTGARHVISWDRVRDVQRDQPETELAAYLQHADQVWRARTRLERDDARLAEPLFERLFERSQGQTHETALVIAEGLCRCLLARQANDAALIAGLEMTRLVRAGVETNAYASLPPILDRATWLCPQLPPFWVDPTGRRIPLLVHELERYDPQGDRIVERCQKIYLMAAQHHVTGNAEIFATADADSAEDSGMSWFLDVVTTLTTTSDDQRQTTLLQASSSADSPWMEAWASVAIGRALLRSTDRQEQLAGVVSILKAAATTTTNNLRYVQAFALAEASQALAQLNNTKGAAALRSELARRFPNHPAIAAADAAPQNAKDAKESS